MKRQSGKIKVFVIDDKIMDGVSWWRNSEPCLALDKMYGQYLEIHQAHENVDIRLLKTADVVIRFRPTSQESLNFLETCKRFGIKIILDIDDDLWHVPPGHPVFLDSLEYSGRLRDVYGLADAIWTSTDELRYVVGDLGRCETMPNAVLPEQLPEKPLEWQKTAAWRGNDKQIADLTSDFAKKWYCENSDRFNWIWAGYVPDFPHEKSVRFQRRMHPLAYFLSLQNGLANIMWKPLVPNRFNDSKSNIALLEAAMSGGVCVTNYAGKPGWETALPDFTDDPDEVAAAFYKSREHILEHYNLERVTEKRFASILKLVNG